MTEIFGHRGYAALYPENTMISFKAAARAGADGIELDVQMTKDGQLVVIHDEKVNRTTNGKGYVKDFTLSKLKKLSASTLYKSMDHAEIPTLEEVFEWLQSNGLRLNIELKNGVFVYEGMEERVIRMVRQYNMEQRTILSSFNHYSLVKCYRLAPEIETAPLYSEGIYMPWVYAESIKASAIHPKHKAAPDFIIKEAQQAGIMVRPYTVNKEEDMVRLFTIGCSAFITDEPAKAIDLRNKIGVVNK